MFLAAATKLGDTLGKKVTDELGPVLFGSQGNIPGISQDTPAEIAGNFMAYAFGLLGIIFLVLAIYGGIVWMTAHGNEEQVTKARSIITQAVVGLLITFAVGSIYLFVRALIKGNTGI